MNVLTLKMEYKETIGEVTQDYKESIDWIALFNEKMAMAINVSEKKN